MNSKPFWSPDVEAVDPSSLHDLEEARLREQLSWVLERSPFYRQKLQGIDPSNFKLENLKDLPFTTKEEIRQSQHHTPPLGEIACVDWQDINRIHASTGTTGNPTLVGATQRDRQMWMDLVARNMWNMGCRPNSRAWVALSFGWWIAGFSFYEGLQHLGAAVLPAGNNDVLRSLRILQKTGVDFVISTPSFISYVANASKNELGIDPRAYGLKHIALGGEPGGGLPETRKQIEETWGAKVYDSLGTADFCTVIWSECSFQEGMHFLGQGYIIPEIIDPKTEEVLEPKPGVIGELVYTAIYRECSPLIRFRIGDLVEVLGDGTCSCGRTSYRIRCVGRTDDMLIIQGVNLFPSAVVDVVSGFRPRTTGEMRIRLKDSQTVIHPPLEIDVEYADAEHLQELKSELELTLRQQLMFRADINLVPPGTLAQNGAMKRSLIIRT